MEDNIIVQISNTVNELSNMKFSLTKFRYRHTLKKTIPYLNFEKDLFNNIHYFTTLYTNSLEFNRHNNFCNYKNMKINITKDRILIESTEVIFSSISSIDIRLNYIDNSIIFRMKTLNKEIYIIEKYIKNINNTSDNLTNAIDLIIKFICEYMIKYIGYYSKKRRIPLC